MSELSLHAAETLLRDHGGYEWLLSDQQFWSVSEVILALKKEGLKVSNDAVARWFKPLPHTQDFGGPIGLRASRNDLILFFASRMSSKELNQFHPS